MKKLIVLIFSMLILTLFVSACGNGEEVEEADEMNFGFPQVDRSNLNENIVAEYTGGEITGEEFASFLAVQAFLNPETPINDDEFREQIIQQLIMERSLSGLSNNDSLVDERVDTIWEQFEMVYGEDIMKEGFATLQVSEEEIRETLAQMFKVEAYFHDQVTEEDKMLFYERVKEELTTATFTHILISTEEMTSQGEWVEIRTEEEALEKANEILTQLQDGADMNELASEFSDDPGSVENGGRYADAFVVELVPEFRSAILEQEINVIGEPVRTDFGYHIIRVEDLQVVPFEEVEEAIVSEVVFEKYYEYLQETLPGQIIEINL